MIKNFLKTAFRNLLKNRGHSVINLLGLSLGLACTILIGLWIREELSMNNFHEHSDRIHRILENQYYSNGFVLTVSATPGVLVPALKEEVPEISHATRLSWGDQHLFTVNNSSFQEKGYYADPDFFDIFTFPLLHGSEYEVLSRPKTMAISESLASRLFERTDVVGKSVRIDNDIEYEISGVFADPPDNSTLKFDFIMPVADYLDRNPGLESWNNNSIRTYLLLQPGVSAVAFNHKIKDFLKDHSDQNNADLFVQSLSDQYLRTDFKDGKYQGGGRITYVRMFALIAIFILLIACINFMNLSTARSATRAREVGVRRVVGASRGTLITQFLGESLLLSFLAGLLAVVIVQLVLPSFNRIFQLTLRFDWQHPAIWSGLLLIVLFTGLLAGSYPAFFLSGFRPVQVLKGVVRTGKGALWFRKGMVVTQFAIAAFLIISTITIYRQMSMMQNRSLGYKLDNLMYVPVNGTLWDKYETVKKEVLQIPGVQGVSSSNGLIYNWGNNTSGVSWEGKNPDDDILFQTIPVGFDFLSTIGAELAEGRDFSPAFPADSNNFIINQESARLMSLDEPVGQQITVSGSEGKVIGLVKDFHVQTLRSEQDPVILMIRPWMNFIYLRLQTHEISKTLSSIEQVLKHHNPDYPFEYSFVDQEYEQLYRSEQQVSALSSLFAFLAIFVSCLGLFGLASFAAEQRTKEIGIRKILGATVAQLISLLSREFIALVLIGFALAIPLAWLLMSRWLESFAYRIELSAWIFTGAGLLSLLVAVLTVSFQSVKAARSNPVEALRYE